MTQMVRKQIYIPRQQEARLKRLAKARGVSEAEIIRQALDRQLSGGASQPFQPDPKAWEEARQFMRELVAQGPLPNRRRQWTRDELYEERLSRYGRDSH
ncbi:MAG: CopG family transcriptional regulator [Anaerolineae bacterium]